MTIKELFKNKGVQIVCLTVLGVMLFYTDIVHAAPGDSIGDASALKSKLGAVIQMIAGVVAPIILSLGLLVGGIKYYNGDEEAFAYIKGGIIGSLIAGACWSIAQWLV